MRVAIIFLGLFLSLPTYAQGKAKISTFLEGRLVERSAHYWVVQTDEGVYWLDVRRPPSWVRRDERNHTISFWVRKEQIMRYRPGLLERRKKTYVAEGKKSERGLELQKSGRGHAYTLADGRS